MEINLILDELDDLIKCVRYTERCAIINWYSNPKELLKKLKDKRDKIMR